MSAHEFMNMARVRAEQMQRERDEARGWVKLLLAPYASDGVREEARRIVAEWDAEEAP